MIIGSEFRPFSESMLGLALHLGLGLCYSALLTVNLTLTSYYD